MNRTARSGSASPDLRVGQAMRRVDGCTPENSARDVVEIMDEMELGFMPVVRDHESRTVVGAVSREGLADAIRLLGAAKAMVRAARLVQLPTVSVDVPLGAVERLVGSAPAYLVVEEEEALVGIVENVREGLR